MSDMLLALEITALGMGLVFAAILLLWWMIHALTSITATKDNTARSTPAPETNVSVSATEEARKAQAAAVAVAIALAEQQASAMHPLSTPPSAMVSAWQLGMRTRQMYQKGIPTRRQPRETGR